MLITILSGLLMAGCTQNIDIGDREPYRSVVGKTVYLRLPMALWAERTPEYTSYPYTLVEGNYHPNNYTVSGAFAPVNGSTLAVLPVGTPLHIDKVNDHYCGDDFHTDALGSVYVASRRETLRFAYMWGTPIPPYAPVSEVPWSFNRK